LFSFIVFATTSNEINGYWLLTHLPLQSKMIRLLFVVIISVFIPQAINAQVATISGYVRDSISQETISKAEITATLTTNASPSNGNPALPNNNTVKVSTAQKAVTNAYGFYSLSLKPGNWKLVVSSNGYQDYVRFVTLTESKELNFNLPIESDAMKAIEITAKRNNNVKSLDVSVQSINGQTIKKIPALLGEPDVIRSVQLLPGVTTVGEGASGFNVRGGGIDQNLVLMDEAPVFNSAHLFGFFSIFNPDAVKDVELVKGGIPAQYGGRLSSTLDVKTRDGNRSRLAGSGGIGTIFSRLTLEGPLALPQGKGLKSLTKNRKTPAKSSFLISGRRSYIDYLAKPFLNDDLAGSQFYFYDLTTKFNYSRGKDNFFISSYIGDDVFKAAGLFGVKWGNSTVTGRWNHVFNNKLFSNFTYFYSRYRYNLEFTNRDVTFNWQSYIVNNSAKADFTYSINPKNTANFGLQSTYYRFIPGDARATSETLNIRFGLPDRFGFENAVYLSNDWNSNGKFSIRAGMRLSQFAYLGPGKVYLYNRKPGKQGILDSTYTTQRGEVVANYIYPEPRLSIKWQTGKTHSIKGGYNRMVQNLHLISNTAASVPFDVWQPTTNNIKPEIADQVSIGYFRNFGKNSTLETSIETYYKSLQNQVDYIDGANLLLNEFLEADLLTGIGRAYGLECYVKKSGGDLTGWISYTLSRSERKVEGINDNNWYANRFDRLHNLAVVVQYKINLRWEFAANFIFSSGTPTTFYTGQYKVQGYTVPDAGSNARNNVRNPDYHRLDLSLTYYRKKNPKWESFWVFSTYNTYNRRNPFSIYFATNFQNKNYNAAIRYSVIGSIVPAISYNFKF
jgi:hypothetical protein